jgi:hypothetical protein
MDDDDDRSSAPRRSESESTDAAAASRSCRDASRTRGTCVSRAHRRSRPRETYTLRVGGAVAAAPSMASRFLRRKRALNPKKLFRSSADVRSRR